MAKKKSARKDEPKPQRALPRGGGELFVKPARLPDGTLLRVPDPDRGTPLPEKGRHVRWGPYWLRRFRAHEIVISLPEDED